RSAAADFVALPQRCDLGGDLVGYLLRSLVGEWSVIKHLQQLRQALALHEHRAPGDLGGMSGEYGNRANRAKGCKRLLETDSGVLDSAKRSSDGAGLRCTVTHLCCTTATLAVVRLCQ